MSNLTTGTIGHDLALNKDISSNKFGILYHIHLTKEFQSRNSKSREMIINTSMHGYRIKKINIPNYEKRYGCFILVSSSSSQVDSLGDCVSNETRTSVIILFFKTFSRRPIIATGCFSCFRFDLIFISDRIITRYYLSKHFINCDTWKIL